MSRVLTALAALLLAAPALVAQDNPGPTEPAYLNVKVPADAKLQVGDHLTQQTGEMRRFVTPGLALGKNYNYTLKATFKGKDGNEVTVEDTVRVAAGKTTDVDLTKPKEVAKTGTPADKKGDEDKAKRPPDVIFVATPAEVVDEMIKVADIKKSDLLYDLGCGDGIIVVTAAKKVGCKAV
ncbi:MAG TPA: TIGR03000 domain-containing protein, partial [Gemmataceae bacterium]|nr:TIGR03000 domain-containing protein [Gemmataceae bacterium]